MRSIVVTLLSLFVWACAPIQNIAYFQNVEPNVAMKIPPKREIRLKPDDKISIVVSSKDQLLDNLFNLPVANAQVGESVSRSGEVSVYTVSPCGDIDFPIIGALRVEGLTRYELSQKIKRELQGRQLVSDPIVTVEFINLSFSVLGEVASPGLYTIGRDMVTLTDALGMAGDLTIQGRRENVTIYRRGVDEQMAYVVDLTDAESLNCSPAFYLEQNDLVYVEPNEKRSRESTVNGNNVRSTSFWFSLISLVTTLSLIIFSN